MNLDSGIPSGWSVFANGPGGTVYCRGGLLVVVGDPDELDPDGHDCDYMGCGREHVIWRGADDEPGIRRAMQLVGADPRSLAPAKETP